MSETHTRHGRMATDRPERYAKQLAGHWARKGGVEQDGEVTEIRFETGQVVRLRPVEGALEVTASVPDGGDADRFAQVVAEHLQRFAQREDLHVEWS